MKLTNIFTEDVDQNLRLLTEMRKVYPESIILTVVDNDDGKTLSVYAERLI